MERKNSADEVLVIDETPESLTPRYRKESILSS